MEHQKKKSYPPFDVYISNALVSFPVYGAKCSICRKEEIFNLANSFRDLLAPIRSITAERCDGTKLLSA